MTDERYVFVSDVKERKRTARGSFNKVRGGGRTVKMPSDYMTRKERDRMNGEVTSYRLNEPVRWKEFKTWPVDIQKGYIDNLLKKYQATQMMIAEMLGVSSQSVYLWGAANGYRFPRRGGRQSTACAEAWFRFLNGVPAANQEETRPETREETRPETREGDNTGDEQKLQDLARIIRALVGSGAKLTIEVTL